MNDATSRIDDLPDDQVHRLAAKLREIQTRLGLRAEDIAEATGGEVPSSTWIGWTRRRDPAAPTVIKLAAACRALGTTIDSLLEIERPREGATICDMATARAILATTDPREIEELLPRPNEIDLFWSVPAGAEYVTTNQALPLDRRVRAHIAKYAPNLQDRLSEHGHSVDRLFPPRT